MTAVAPRITAAGRSPVATRIAVTAEPVCSAAPRRILRGRWCRPPRRRRRPVRPPDERQAGVVAALGPHAALPLAVVHGVGLQGEDQRVDHPETQAVDAEEGETHGRGGARGPARCRRRRLPPRPRPAGRNASCRAARQAWARWWPLRASGLDDCHGNEEVGASQDVTCAVDRDGCNGEHPREKE